MSIEVIFFFAVGVFILMMTGVYLTMVEFNKLTDDPSIRKGANVEQEVNKKAG